LQKEVDFVVRKRGYYRKQKLEVRSKKSEERNQKRSGRLASRSFSEGWRQRQDTHSSEALSLSPSGGGKGEGSGGSGRRQWQEAIKKPAINNIVIDS